MGAVAFLVSFGAFAVTPSELSVQLGRGGLTVIDIRPTDVYAVGHIPGAINVPAPIVAEKKLPPLGKVVVYDGGIGPDKTATAIAALNQKPGISAESLAGGFAAWESVLPAQSTRQAGQGKEALTMITYKDLKTIPGKDLLLVDLRHPSDPASGQTTKVQHATAQSNETTEVVPLTDLPAAFPGARIVSSPFESGPSVKRIDGSEPLTVLIDNGDGSAQAMARLLRANGNRRYAILAGGEYVLAREGQSGLQRLGASVAGPGKVPAARAAAGK
jgi:rhodanese-related sulfurtransferase